MASIVYDFVAVHTPAEDAADETVKIVHEGRIIAKNPNAALMAIARQIPPEFSDKLDELEVTIRPF